MTRALVTAGVLLGVAALGALAGHDTYSLFSSKGANAGNSVSAGTVTLGDDDGGTALFTLTGGRPGGSASGCVRVTSSGSLPTGVRVYGSSSGALAAYATLTITRGTQASSSRSCSGFSADATDYTGAGAGVIYQGALSALPASSAAGLADPTAAWSTGEVHAYRVTITLGTSSAAEATSGSATVTWQGSSQ